MRRNSYVPPPVEAHVDRRLEHGRELTAQLGARLVRSQPADRHACDRGALRKALDGRRGGRRREHREAQQEGRFAGSSQHPASVTRLAPPRYCWARACEEGEGSGTSCGPLAPSVSTTPPSWWPTIRARLVSARVHGRSTAFSAISTPATWPPTTCGVSSIDPWPLRPSSAISPRSAVASVESTCTTSWV